MKKKNNQTEQNTKYNEINKLDWDEISILIMNLEKNISEMNFKGAYEYCEAVEYLEKLEEVKWDMVTNQYSYERHSYEHQSKFLLDDENQEY